MFSQRALTANCCQVSSIWSWNWTSMNSSLPRRAHRSSWSVVQNSLSKDAKGVSSRISKWSAPTQYASLWVSFHIKSRKLGPLLTITGAQIKQLLIDANSTSPSFFPTEAISCGTIDRKYRYDSVRHHAWRSFRRCSRISSGDSASPSPDSCDTLCVWECAAGPVYKHLKVQEPLDDFIPSLAKQLGKPTAWCIQFNTSGWRSVAEKDQQQYCFEDHSHIGSRNRSSPK